MPSSPICFPAHVPVVAISTAPGLPSDGSQHPISVVGVVVGISGLVHQVAARNGSPPRSAETICHGGTLRWEGFEMSTTPLDNLSFVAVWLEDTFPRPLTSV